jgi:hypothetical protein
VQDRIGGVLHRLSTNLSNRWSQQDEQLGGLPSQVLVGQDDEVHRLRLTHAENLLSRLAQLNLCPIDINLRMDEFKEGEKSGQKRGFLAK